MQYFLDNPAHLWFVIAGLSFVIELSIMGLSGPLLFFAIACLATGILVSLGYVNGWQSEILAVGLLTAVTSPIKFSNVVHTHYYSIVRRRFTFMRKNS